MEHAKKRPKKRKTKYVKRKVNQDGETDEEDKISYKDDSFEDQLELKTIKIN